MPLRTLPVLVLALLVASASASSQTTAPALPIKGESLLRLPSPSASFVTPKNHECVEHSIQCGETIRSNLTTHDCESDEGIFFDVYSFHGVAGQTVTVDLGSSAFDAFLVLCDLDELDCPAEDDDSGVGTDARIVYTLNRTSSEWTILAGTFFPGETGPYTLSLVCSGQPPPPTCPTGFFDDPSYPDFCFRVTVGNPGSTIAGVREAECLAETVCVSGALPGRSEAFLRIIGPRPNGFLWPTIVRFTPSRLVVDMLQLSSGQTNRYVLPAVPPGTDDLPGLQGRLGFLP